MASRYKYRQVLAMAMRAQLDGMAGGGADAGQTVDLRGRSYGERGRTQAALEDALLACGCWLHDRRDGGADSLELVFEMQLRSVVELYSELLAAGLDLGRDSHLTMAGLCTLRRHHPRERSRRPVTVRLEVRFMEEAAAEPGLMAMGLA